MPRNPEQDRSTVIAQALSRGLSTSQISGVMGVSKRTVTRVSSNLKKHGSPKAPPSGAKQGRPAKVTRSQAQALLSWVTAKDYVFYVKDLVKFLKANHGYKGCDGTVRRALIRAGFRRKEPFRKSEMTHWMPPNHPVNFVVITEDNGEDVDDDGDEEVAPADGQASPDQPSHDIAPAPVQPNMASSDPMQMLPAQSMQSFQPQPVQGMDPLNVAQLQAASGVQLDTQSSQDFRLDPALRAVQPPSSAPEQQVPQGQSVPSNQPSQQTPAPSVPQMQAPIAATGPQVQATPASGKKRKQAQRADDPLRQQVDTLQSQLAQQADIIKRLQAQLLQSQGMPMAQQMPGSTPQFHTMDRSS